LRVTFAGHSTVLIELDRVRVLTDPVLRRRFLHIERRVPSVDVGLVAGVDVVLVSHAHHDHLDRPSLRKLGSATIVVPAGAAQHVPGRRRVIEVMPGDALSFGALEIKATYADHRPGRLRHRGSPALGYTIAGTQRAYFAGDTDVFPGMRDLGAAGLDLALLPVWGWGTQIGAGHLDPRRAAEALALLEPRVAVPVHWGTFYPLGLRRFRPHLMTEPPRAFAREAARRAPGVEVRVLEPGAATTID
jgi:L-ascorbate metabolism protein UlaG (beta-lactamase superfamily)